MAHPDRVLVGKRQAKFAPHRAMILADHVQLAPDILCRLNDPRQNVPGDEIFEIGVEHDEWSVVSGRWSVSNYRRNSTMATMPRRLLHRWFSSKMRTITEHWPPTTDH